MVTEEYIDVKLDIFEYTGQRARVRKTLTVNALVDEILREFDDIPADTPNKYIIYLKGSEDPLDEDQTLTQLDIQPQDELVFEHFRRSIRQMLPPEHYAVFVEEKSGQHFDIKWQPAIIGRPSNDMDHNIVLAVSLQTIPEGKTISRSHAQISFFDNHYFIEPLAEYNPVFLNGKALSTNNKFEIKNGDKIILGYKQVTLVFNPQASDKNQTEKAPSQHGEASRTEKEQEPVGNLLKDERENTVMDDVPLSIKLRTPKLVIEKATDSAVVGEVIILEEFPYLLGRTHPILTAEDKVSRKHAEVICDENQRKYFIRDLKSTNGVWVDGKMIEANVPVEITFGNKIRLGVNLVVRFEA